MSLPLSVGIVGFGLSARVFHAPLIACNPSFKLLAFVERTGSKSLETYPGTKLYRTLRDLCLDPEIDLVIITTPSGNHYHHCKEVILAGKHCVVEKPFTVTSAEAFELAELAFENHILLSVFHNRRWDGDHLTAKDVIKNKLIGNVVEYENHFDRFRNLVRPNSWREQNLPGSGLLYDLGSHLIDQALDMFGIPQSVSADVRIQRENGKSDDYFHIELHYDPVRNLKVTLKAGSLVREVGPKLVIHGNHGSFVKYGMDPQENALRSGKTPKSMDLEWGREPEELWGTLNTDIKGLHFKGKVETVPGSYQKYYENIVESLGVKRGIYDPSKLKVTATQAARVIEIIELAIESSQKQQRLAVYK